MPRRSRAARGLQIEGVVASECEMRPDHLVIAAGAASVAVAGLAGAELPGFPVRIECMALEPTRSILRPGVAFIDRLCYVSQTARDEVVGGAEVVGKSESLTGVRFTRPWRQLPKSTGTRFPVWLSYESCDIGQD
jgi:glycine/D-amino acid oxidase-like deaminating enzyme